MSGNIKTCEFNNYINIILLIMFVLVVAVSFGFKCCDTSQASELSNTVTMSKIDSLNITE